MPRPTLTVLIGCLVVVAAAARGSENGPPSARGAVIAEVAPNDVTPAAPKSPQQPDTGGFAWTDFDPSPDTRFVFVSASTGSDSNTGLAPDAPVATLARGLSLIRDGHPDWLLLRRGDIWTDQDFGKITKAGRSPEEPILITSYGEDGDRPLIQTGQAKRGIFLDGTKGASFIAIAGIELHAHTYDGSAGAEAGVLWLGPGKDLLIEDCAIRGYKDNVVLNGFKGTLSNAKVRASVIVDSFSAVSHSQGLFASKVEGLLVEGCVFDHNGWNDDVDGAEATVFNHNLYVQRDCEDVTITGNMFSNAAAHEIILRADAEIAGNLFIHNPIAIVAGDNDEPAPNPIQVEITGNVILYGSDIAPELPRGFGIDLFDLEESVVADNVIAHDRSSQPWGHAIMVHGTAGAPVKSTKIIHNTIYAWRGGLQHDEGGMEGIIFGKNLLQATDSSVPVVKHKGKFSKGVSYGNNVYHSEAPPVLWFEVGKELYNFAEWQEMAGERGSKATGVAFADPERTPETYQQSIGEPASLEDFIAAVRDQAKIDWDPRYETTTLLDYFRDGFTAPNLPKPSPGALIGE